MRALLLCFVFAGAGVGGGQWKEVKIMENEPVVIQGGIQLCEQNSVYQCLNGVPVVLSNSLAFRDHSQTQPEGDRAPSYLLTAVGLR